MRALVRKFAMVAVCRDSGLERSHCRGISASQTFANLDSYSITPQSKSDYQFFIETIIFILKILKLPPEQWWLSIFSNKLYFEPAHRFLCTSVFIMCHFEYLVIVDSIPHLQQEKVYPKVSSLNPCHCLLTAKKHVLCSCWQISVWDRQEKIVLCDSQRRPLPDGTQ